ncbi:MAG TPA: excinuclease ABC subunit C [Chlorobaculum sp.]|uniref:UvrABC system protein C n=1 Tax=Chlorobaculum tepidum (strain ATCC 49652 / DSM 12025 / NBRC 103806 / TLS) TaxID=194439 RepID=UVRC_CHLTE|nr:excinuclease ABC subunit UvrC [Chlorobaculum tepidum]Q8KBI0.1 RecName: Full=UvrABC system protein C; Short=Protein UvrC; AltName: Full=Excinuclease ABC subunit C [Chlorobaculum tepidum TLS]AAM73028.1 excinuclease ABC, subunit C [Chlorobaculum tepidum TLS]HBU24473.1 excinuclease ABC subunit C [Chlorobaculum sp.]
MSDTAAAPDKTAKSALAEKLATLPTSPGVYRFSNAAGTVIYVGKARNLRNRVRSYFNSQGRQPGKTAVMVSHIADLNVIITSSEVEALILENNLIKELKPRYNVNLKDDKSYPWLVITNERFPRIFLTRQVRRDGSLYFGPYTEASQLRLILDLIGSIFPVRSCKYKLTEEAVASGRYRVCLDYHIHKCKGPCEGLQSEEEYQAMIREIVTLLKGKTSALLRDLSAEMQKKAKELKFEEAAALKAQIEGLKRYAERQKIVSTEAIDRDVFAVAAGEDDACGVVFRIREGKLIGSRHTYLSNTGNTPLPNLLASFVEHYYLETPDLIPQELMLQAELPEEELEALRQLLSSRQTERRQVRFTVPRIGEKAHLIAMCLDNAKHHLHEFMVQKKLRGEIARKSPALESLKQVLHLGKLPERIECFDNSHFQGTDYVSSMVTFVSGKPKKSDYRKFRLKSFEGSDDYAAMREAVTRRYGGSLAGELPLPDLVLIDGGKGQVNVAWQVLQELGLDLPVAGLAKRLEEIYVPNEPDPYNLPKTSPALKLLQQLRDEAHRFAITYHRKLRSDRTIRTELTGIKGVGEKSAEKLLKHFGSVESVSKASIDELSAVAGRKTAESIYRYFNAGDAP